MFPKSIYDAHTAMVHGQNYRVDFQTSREINKRLDALTNDTETLTKKHNELEAITINLEEEIVRVRYEMSAIHHRLNLIDKTAKDLSADDEERLRDFLTLVKKIKTYHELTLYKEELYLHVDELRGEDDGDLGFYTKCKHESCVISVSQHVLKICIELLGPPNDEKDTQLTWYNIGSTA